MQGLHCRGWGARAKLPEKADTDCHLCRGGSSPRQPRTLRGSFARPATMAWPYGLPDVPSSLFFTITAFFPAYLPVSRITTFPGCITPQKTFVSVQHIMLICQSSDPLPLCNTLQYCQPKTVANSLDFAFLAAFVQLWIAKLLFERFSGFRYTDTDLQLCFLKQIFLAGFLRFKPLEHKQHCLALSPSGTSP